MGSYDGAETCELVGLYILSKINAIIPKENVGLYRDDGLAVTNKPPRAAEKIKKELCEKFKTFGLQITANANIKVLDFLDVTFDLNSKSYKPYSKPENTNYYVNIESNHPIEVTKRIPHSIQTRLSNISSSQEIFDEAKPQYQEALQKAGHKFNLTFNPTDSNSNRNRNKNRKRNITWFNPPFSKHVSNNIGKKFIHLISKHFPKEHPLHSICNRNTIKISYSCMNNMRAIVKSHNNIITANKPQQEDNCNCRNKTECPLPGKCTTKNIVYRAIVTTTNSEKSYIGITSDTFKSRFANHKSSFNNRCKKNQTELSKYIWQLKDKNTPFSIKWKIEQHAKPYSPNTKRCNLCLSEKYHIVTAQKNSLLNSRSELISTCRHKTKFLLSDYG